MSTAAVQNEMEAETNSNLNKEEIFESSTHTYMIYFDSSDNKSVNNFVLAVITILMQVALYFVMINEAMTELHDSKPKIEASSWDDCNSDNEIDSDSILQCSGDDPTINTILGGFPLSCILLVYFIAYDLLSCIKIWYTIPTIWAKLMGLIIFFEALLAFFTGIIFAFNAVGNGSSFDAVVNCVGVLFVHDLDEKMFQAIELIKTDEINGKCCCCFNKCFRCCCIISVLFASIIIGFISVFIISTSVYDD